jgi:hypothetical protein
MHMQVCSSKSSMHGFEQSLIRCSAGRQRVKKEALSFGEL